MNDRQNGQQAADSEPLYITLILDESGSMQSCKGAAIAGFNQYVATLRNEPVETHVTLTLFHSGKTEVRHRRVSARAVQDLDVETYRPRDTTPLCDAIGGALTATKQEVPATARKLCVILMDGMENASQEYTRKQVFDLIKKCEKQGWAFLYLGADHDVWAAGESLGVVQEYRIAFDKRAVAETFNTLSLNTARYRRRKASDKGPIWEDRPSDEEKPSLN